VLSWLAQFFTVEIKKIKAKSFKKLLGLLLGLA